MLSCDAFRDRLYDEDARRALDGWGALPADLAAHRESCPSCRAYWDEAVQDLQAFAQGLVEPAPRAVAARAEAAFARVHPAPATHDWATALTWAALGASAVATAAPWLADLSSVVALAAIAAGGALAFAGSLARQALTSRR